MPPSVPFTRPPLNGSASHILRLNTGCGAHSDMDIDTSSTSPASTLRLSPFTPSLTGSPTIGSSTTSSPRHFPDCLPQDRWFANDTTSWSLSSARELSPSALVRHPDADVRPKKKARHSAKLDNEPTEHSLPTARLPPAVVAIPPAQACDLPLDLVKKPARKRAPAPARNKSAKPKDSPAPQPQPVRFRFVSVQHAETNEPDVSGEFEEHMEEDTEEGPFEHGPSELPPRPYPGGEYAVSPLRPPQKTGKIPASTLDFLPVLEARFARLENAIDRYVEIRAQKALYNSILPEARPGSSPPPARRRTKLDLR